MGYRSDVVIAINKDAYDQEMLLGVGRDDAFHNSARLINDTYYWVFKHTKWSEFYPGVSYIESLMDALDLVSDNPYGFLRVGEDHLDMETRGVPYDYEIYPYMQIEYPEYLLNQTQMIGEQNATAAA